MVEKRKFSWIITDKYDVRGEVNQNISDEKVAEKVQKTQIIKAQLKRRVMIQKTTDRSKIW